MTSSRTKITLSRWEDNRPTSRSLLYLDQYDVDTGIESINKKLRETRFIEPIVYNKQNDKIREATELLNETVKYISGVIDDVDELIDEPFFQAYNEVDGVLEDLKRIVLDDYKVKNTLGITEEVIDYANSSSMADLATKEIVKETIGLKDLLHNDDISGVGELQSFSELFKEQYETLSEANEDLANMSYGEYVESLIGRSNIQHTVDKGWLNVLGDALDIIGITSLIGCFTGTNVFTGQILTPGERKSAAFTAIVNIGSLALAISTAGAGGLLALGFKGATKVVATGTFKWCMVNMISGMSGLLVGGVLDMLGAPTWLKIAGTVGGAALGRSIANKKLFTTVVKVTIDDIANKTGLPENQIQDIMNYKKMTAEQLALALNGGASIESLLELPEMNMKYLMEQTGLLESQIQDIMSYKQMKAEQLALVLHGGASIESLLGVPDMNMKYLMEQTGMSAEEIGKLLDAKNQNIIVLIALI